MRIAFLTSFDPHDRRTGSCTFYYMIKALQEYCGEVTSIGPLPTIALWVGKLLNKMTQVVLHKQYAYYMSCFLAKRYAQVASQRLAERPFDVIIAPFGTVTTAFLETTIPVVLIEDATFVLLHNYHARFSQLLHQSIRDAEMITARALKKAHLLVFSSTWAANSAIEHYQIHPERVVVLPFGANIEHAPSWEMISAKHMSRHCKLLFVGVDWQEKGGPIALETLIRLEEAGIQAELTICGCSPPATEGHSRMTVIPFLDRNNPEEYELLEQLYREADFLLLPTRNDCTPTVCCEANAFGVPVLTARTGGVPELIINGKNGFVLPYAARGMAYAAVIAGVYHNDWRYQELVRTSKAMYDERMNWHVWGRAMKQALERTLMQ